MFLENGTFSYPFLLFCGPQAATAFEEWTYGLSLASAFLATGCAFWGLNYSVGQLSTNKCRGDRQGWVWGLAWGMLGEIWLALLGSEYSVSMEAWDSTSWRALGRQFKMRWTRRLPNWKPPDPSSIPILKWKPLDQANIPMISSTSHVGVITITLTMIHQLFLYHLIPHVF